MNSPTLGTTAAFSIRPRLDSQTPGRCQRLRRRFRLGLRQLNLGMADIASTLDQLPQLDYCIWMISVSAGNCP